MEYLYWTLGILAFLVVSFLISHFLVIRMLFGRFYGREELPVLEQYPLPGAYYDKCRERIFAARRELEQIPHKEISISSFDGVELVAEFYDFGKEKTAVLMHGYRALPFNNFGVLSQSLMERGYNVLLPYQRAHGKSGGKYTSFGKFESEDLLRWIDYLDRNTGCKSILIGGISMGAATVGAASDRITCKKVKALVMDCGFVSLEALMDHIIKTGHYPGWIFLPGMKRMLKKKLGMTFTDFNVPDSLSKCNIPSLFISGSADHVVPKDSMERYYSACAAPKELLVVEGAGHGVALLDGGEEAFDRFYKFVDQFI